MNFEITAAQAAQVATWLHEIEQKGLADGKLRSELEALGYGDANTPYYGATGGCLTYLFTPTSIGDVVCVRHDALGVELNITDYDSW